MARVSWGGAQRFFISYFIFQKFGISQKFTNRSLHLIISYIITFKNIILNLENKELTFSYSNRIYYPKFFRLPV